MAKSEARNWIINSPKMGIKDVLKFIKSARKKFLIVTPNAEITLLALSDSHYNKVIESADLRLPEMGVVLAQHYLQSKRTFWDWLSTFYLLPFTAGRLHSVRGREVAEAIIASGLRTYQFGGRRQGMPWFNDRGEPVSDKDRLLEKQVIDDINKYKPDILFVGLGAPKQEYWVRRNWDRLTGVKGIMCVGRTFEFQSLPPKFVSSIGLEWLWRLATGSTSLKRIFNALILFPIRVRCNLARCI